MGLFQAQRGFTHFVFANQKDSYILPGLVQMDLNGYLYYLLKEQGYRNIYFVSGLEAPFRMEAYDGASREQYMRYGRKTGFWGKGTQDVTEDPRVFSLSEDLPKRFVNLLKKSSDGAFVFRLDTFYEIFSRDRGLLKEFVRTGQKFLEQNSNVLILQMPLTANGSMEYLTARDGIFADMDGVSLCPEVGRILEQERNVKLYEQLALDMEDRCVFLDWLNYDQTCLTVQAAYLANPDLSWDSEQIKDLAAFVYAWYSNAQFRDLMGPVLPRDESRRVRKLVAALGEESNRWRLRRSIATLDTHGQKLRHYLRENYPPDREVPCILAEDRLAKRLDRIQIPQSFYGNAPELRRVILGSFRGMVQEYQAPRSRPCCKALEEILESYVDVLEKAVEKGDTETFERAVKYLNYGPEREFRYGENDWQGWSIRTTILQLSDQLFELDRLIRGDNEQIAAFRQKKNALIEEIEKEKTAMGGVLTGLTAREHTLSVKMHQAVDLDRMIEKQIHARAGKESSRSEQLTALHNLELAAGSLGLGISQNVEQVLHQAMELMERDVFHSQKTEMKISQIDHSMNLVMREMAAPVEETDVLAEYEKMMGSIGEEPLILLE